MRKFPASGKPVIIYTAFIFFQEMTGDLVDDHFTIRADLQKFFYYSCCAGLQISCQLFGFLFRYIYH